MNLNELRDKAYKNACEHGFHDTDYSNSHWLMLVVGEISEMVEADRKGIFANVASFKVCDTINDLDFKDKFQMFIKDTVEDEMADVVIRLLDLAGLRQLELRYITERNIEELVRLMDYHRDLHSTCPSSAFLVSRILTEKKKVLRDMVASAIEYMFAYAKLKNIDLMWHIEQKMRYNEMRPHLNGKLY